MGGVEVERREPEQRERRGRRGSPERGVKRSESAQAEG